MCVRVVAPYQVVTTIPLEHAGSADIGPNERIGRIEIDFLLQPEIAIGPNKPLPIVIASSGDDETGAVPSEQTLIDRDAAALLGEVAHKPPRMGVVFSTIDVDGTGVRMNSEIVICKQIRWRTNASM